MTACDVPTRWRSVIPHLGYSLPADRRPDRPEWPAGPRPVQVNLPMTLARQQLLGQEYWDIPDEVVQAYRRYRPTPLWRAAAFERAVGATVPIWAKYEGGNISGSHKYTTALAQAYYYKQAGVRELVTGTGAGQWGTALAAACSHFGLKCTVFMVGSSLQKKPYRGILMRLLGADVHASPSRLTEVARKASSEQSNGLSLALGEAVEYASHREGVAFSSGSGESYSILHQSVIGLESIEQLAAAGAQVDAVVGSVGAGSNFGGIALPFVCDASATGGRAPLLVGAESASTPKLTRGVYAYDQTDATGTGPLEAMYTIGSSYSVPDSHSAGLRYHGAAKVISAMRHHGQLSATAVDQVDALEAGRLFAVHEATLPAPESGHALAAAARIATGRDPDHRATLGVLVCVSGHGYLDLMAYEQLMQGELRDQRPDDSVLAEAMVDLAGVGASADLMAPA